jgi:hypothetical protein
MGKKFEVRQIKRIQLDLGEFFGPLLYRFTHLTSHHTVNQLPPVWKAYVKESNNICR